MARVHRWIAQRPAAPVAALVAALTAYHFIWSADPRTPVGRLATSGEFGDLTGHLLQDAELRWAYRVTEYDAAVPIHSILLSCDDDYVLQWCQGQALRNHCVVNHPDDTMGCRNAWARGQYYRQGMGFVIANWAFATRLLPFFDQMRLTNAQPVSFADACHTARMAPGDRYWWSFVTFCVNSRLVVPERIDMPADMYMMGTHHDVCPEEIRAATRRLMAPWVAVPVTRPEVPALPPVALG
jgi:hypothetical protein